MILLYHTTQARKPQFLASLWGLPITLPFLKKWLFWHIDKPIPTAVSGLGPGDLVTESGTFSLRGAYPHSGSQFM